MYFNLINKPNFFNKHHITLYNQFMHYSIYKYLIFNEEIRIFIFEFFNNFQFLFHKKNS